MLRTLLADAGVDMLLVVIVPPPMFDVAGVAEQLAAVLTRSAKPCVVCLMGGGQAKRARQVLRAAHVLEYPFPARAVSALGALWQRVCWLEEAGGPPARVFAVGAGAGRSSSCKSEPLPCRGAAWRSAA